jgi:uncharacterized RDD family membrane protein YckC
VTTNDTTTTTQQTSAPLLRRFGALLIDWLLCVGVSLFFASATKLGWIPVGILILEYTFFIGLFRQTPGMKVLGLKCVSVHDGNQIGILPAFFRGVLLALVLPPLLMDSAQRGLHDRLTGSIVLPANAPAPTAPVS